jgi:hypothetical protein
MSCTSCSYKVPLSFFGVAKSEKTLKEEQKCTQLMCFVEENKSVCVQFMLPILQFLLIFRSFLQHTIKKSMTNNYNTQLFNSPVGSDWYFVNEFNRCRQLLDGDNEWRVRDKRCWGCLSLSFLKNKTVVLCLDYRSVLYCTIYLYDSKIHIMSGRWGE